MKILKITSISLLALIISCGGSQTTTTPVKLKMSDQDLNEAIYRYLSIYENVDPNIASQFAMIVKRNASIFNYLIDATTDPEFLPYIEKYSDLKMQFKNQPINTNIKVLFSTHPLKTSDHNSTINFSGYCHFFNRVVFIDRDFWQSHKDNERIKEGLLFHELGHCDLDREHFFLTENFSSSIQIENFSFMNGDILQSLLLKPFTRSQFPPQANYNVYHYQIDTAKEDLDQTFQSMYKELFSKENTRSSVVCEADGECTDILQEQMLYEFQVEVISVLRHATIGPSQGNDLQDIRHRLRLQYICHHYNNNNDEPLNDYLEEQTETTREEMEQHCQQSS